MKNILILGSLPKDDEKKNLYETIINVCEKYSNSVKSPIDTAEFQGTTEERYERAFQTVKEADLIIGEQSEPSTGQGMEVREAAILKKSVIIVAKTGSKISGLIKECPVVKDIIYYNGINDLKEKLDEILEKL